MKMKVLDVVTMAGNDHRVTLENDEVKIDIQFKSYEAFAEVDFKPGDEIENLLGASSGSGPDAHLLDLKDEQIKKLQDQLQTLTAGIATENDLNLNTVKAANLKIKNLSEELQSEKANNADAVSRVKAQEAEIAELKTLLNSINPNP